MSIVNKKIKNYKREIIKHYKWSLISGWATPEEIEMIANKEIVDALCNERTRKLFVEDKK